MVQRPSGPQKIVLWLLAIAVITIGYTTWLVWSRGGPWLDRTVRERIETAVRQAVVDGYHFDMDSLRAEFISGDVHIQGLRLWYDSALVDSLRSGVHDYLFAADAHTIALRGLSIWRAVLRHEIHLRSVEVDSPAFHYTIGSDQVALAAPFERLGRSGTKGPDLFAVEAVSVRGARARMHDLGGHLPVLRIVGLDISADHLSVTRGHRVRHADLNVSAVDLHMDSLSTDIPGGYRLRLGDTQLSDHQHRGHVHHLILERIDELAPSHRSTRLRIEVDSLVFLEPDVAGSLGDRALYMRTLGIHGLRLVAELDKDVPEGPARAVALPPAALLASPFPFHVDSAYLIGGRVVYRERSDQTGLWGVLSLKDVNATFTGLHSQGGQVGGPPLVGDIHCAFMDTAWLHAHYEAQLDGTDNFQFTARMEHFPLPCLDSLTSNLLRLSIVEGELQHLDLTMKGNATKARGSMEMKYVNVVTTVASNATAVQRHRMFGSVMDFVMNDDQGGGLSDQRRRTVAVDRDPERSVFSYIWHFTRAGIKRNMTPGATDRVFDLLRKESQERRKRKATRSGRS